MMSISNNVLNFEKTFLLTHLKTFSEFFRAFGLKEVHRIGKFPCLLKAFNQVAFQNDVTVFFNGSFTS